VIRAFGSMVRRSVSQKVEALIGKLIEFRLVDTGGHFFGPQKVVKVEGAEPIDLCRQKPLLSPVTSGLMTLEFA
jgi:hypothetical protein